MQDPILIFFRIWFSTICKLSDFLMHLWMFFSLFFWSLIISPDSLLSLSVHLVSISLWLRPQVIGCLQLSWTEATNSWAAPHHHAPTGIYPANTSSWANWPLTVCLAALKNHQSVSDRLFSNSVSSVQLIVNTSRESQNIMSMSEASSKLYLAASASQVKWCLKRKLEVLAVFDGNSITSSPLACQKSDTKVPSKA